MKNWRVILLAGFIAGGIDLSYALVFYGTRGVPPHRIPQSIASGLLGADSFKGGWTSIALGVALQFVIATSMAAVYYLASRKFSILTRRALISGITYGALAYCFMHFVVVPLSASPKFKSTPVAMLSDFAVHMFGIGLPIALITKHFKEAQTLCAV